ncbi:MAG: Wzz/FepE/Etk N-terminal domain-containing protein, partial [Gammaproteobacteria bacterium]
MNTEPKQSAETAMRNPDPSQVKPAADSPAWPVNYPPGDEIDLVDLGVLLWRRWRLMLAVFLVIVVLAILLAVFKRPSYEYTSGISLGYTVASNGSVVPMVSSQTAVNALQNVYVPFASAQYLQQSQASVNLPKFTVTAG